MIRRMAIICVVIIFLFQTASVVLVATYSPVSPLPKAAAIVVVSGPWTPESEPPGETRARVEAGLALWQNGLAPLVVMSGGETRGLGIPSDAAIMADFAVSRGLPREAVRVEPASHSTLQNAWFTARLPEVDPQAPILLVTHLYHLKRAELSFRWAGFENITPVAAKPAPLAGLHLLEGLKWPLNILRAGGVSAALALGVDEDHVVNWLH